MPSIRPASANAGPNAQEGIVQEEPSWPTVRDASSKRGAEGVLGLQERVCLGASGHLNTGKRGAAQGLRENSGRREGRWEGEGKRSSQEQANRKGRLREEAEQDSRRTKKGSTEVAVGTSEQEPDWICT